MSYTIPKFKYIDLPIFAFLVFSIAWVILLALCISSSFDNKAILLVDACIEPVIHLVLIFYIIKFCKILPPRERKLFVWILMAAICLFLNDTFYFILFYYSNIFEDNLWKILYIVPEYAWLCSSGYFLIKVLLSYVLESKIFYKILLYILIFDFIVITVFVFSSQWDIVLFSLDGFYQITKAYFEVLVFLLGISCLIFSKNTGVQLLITGIIILVSGDFWIIFSYITNTFTANEYGELFWMLGLTISLFGLTFLVKTNQIAADEWFNSVRAIKSRLVLLVSSISISSFTIFFALAYLFKAIDAQFLSRLPFFVGIYSVVVVLISIFIGKYFELPFTKILKNIDEITSKGEKSIDVESLTIEEFSILQSYIQKKIQLKNNEVLYHKKMENMAIQIAHDIRSPVVALNVLIKHTPTIPEKQRIMLKNVSNSINNIANSLLDRNKINRFEHGKQCTTEPLVTLLNSICSEKKVEYYNHPSIVFNIDIPENYNHLFVTVDTVSFRRMISNLINNSVESIHDKGHINILLKQHGEKVIIEIIDSGCGIPQQVIDKIITNKDIVTTKKDGNGIGLISAYESIESCCGSLDLSSKIGHGTTVTLTLPISKPSEWFASEIKFDKNSVIIIIDDDQSIHDVWQYRISSELLTDDLNLINLYSTQELLDYPRSKDIKYCYLYDYEFSNKTSTGLDAIEDLNIASSSMLVTSRFEDENIRKRCLKLGLRILPKEYAPYIPISIIN